MTETQKIEKIRARCWHSISCATAHAAGPNAAGEWMTQADIQSFIAHCFLPDSQQLRRLAYYLGVPL